MSLIVGINSYIGLETANGYFNGRLNSAAWTKASEPDRERALLAATVVVDRLSFTGAIVTTDQPLAWPRRDVRDREGRPVSVAIVPEAVTYATCEWAIHFLANSTPPAAVRSKRVGDLQIDYRATAADTVPPAVRAFLAPFLTGASHSVELMS